MPQQHQARVAVGLVVRLAHEPERGRSCAGAGDRHAERIVENAVRCRLAAVGDASGTAKRIRVVELARTTAALT